MRRKQLHSALLLLAAGVGVGAAARANIIPLKRGGRGSAIHKHIEELERRWRSAVLANDADAEAALLAESYVGIGPAGTISSKNEELQARAAGQERLQKYVVEERKIRIYGTTAVVTSKVRIQGVYAGQPLLGDYRYTRVWSLAHGQWRIVSFEANRVHDSSARRED